MRAARARELAARFPQSAEVLELVAAAYALTGEEPVAFDDTQPLAERLRAALGELAPEPVRAAVPDVRAYFNSPDPYNPGSFFSRLALEGWARHAPLQSSGGAPNECPRCGHAPQVGVLRPAGNGDALFLACSLCRQEWPYRRGCCPQCGETDAEKLDYYTASAVPYAQTQTCRTCNAYVHLLSPERELALVPEVDELALLPLDVWALEQGFHKVWPNLAGL